jgi:hypothetical protein
MGLGREWDLYTNRTAMHLEGQVAQVFRKWVASIECIVVRPRIFIFVRISCPERLIWLLREISIIENGPIKPWIENETYRPNQHRRENERISSEIIIKRKAYLAETKQQTRTASLSKTWKELHFNYRIFRIKITWKNIQWPDAARQSCPTFGNALSRTRCSTAHHLHTAN